MGFGSLKFTPCLVFLGVCALSGALAACSGNQSQAEESQGSELAQEISLKLSCRVTHFNGIEVGKLPSIPGASAEALNLKVMVESGIIKVANFDKSTVVSAPYTNEDGTLGVAISENGSGAFFALYTNNNTASLNANEGGIALYSCSDDANINESDFIKTAQAVPQYQTPQQISFKANKIVKRFNPDVYPKIEAVSLTENVLLREIILNRGNCNLMYAFKFPSGETLPLELNYGDKIQFLGDCDPSEVTFVTDQGSTTINW